MIFFLLLLLFQSLYSMENKEAVFRIMNESMESFGVELDSRTVGERSDWWIKYHKLLDPGMEVEFSKDENVQVNIIYFLQLRQVVSKFVYQDAKYWDHEFDLPTNYVLTQGCFKIADDKNKKLCLIDCHTGTEIKPIIFDKKGN